MNYLGQDLDKHHVMEAERSEGVEGVKRSYHDDVLRNTRDCNFYNWQIHIQSKNIPLGILCQKVHLGKNSSIFGTLIYDHIV